MDLYPSSATDYFRIDDLLDFSNEDLFSASTAVADHHLSPPRTIHSSSTPITHPSISSDFTDQLSIPSDDAAELEWLSQFVDDSCINFPPNLLTGTINFRSDTSKARSKRSRAATTNNTWISAPESTTVKSKCKRESNNSRASSPTIEGGVRRCTHCASEKTPQWRTGPLGPKTLCNACGVRFKSGRLVPEYRPAASPTFVLTQHSNSHRKVLELRRQKEMSKQQLEEQRSYHHHRHHQHDFEVC